MPKFTFCETGHIKKLFCSLYAPQHFTPYKNFLFVRRQCGEVPLLAQRRENLQLVAGRFCHEPVEHELRNAFLRPELLRQIAVVAQLPHVKHLLDELVPRKFVCLSQHEPCGLLVVHTIQEQRAIFIACKKRSLPLHHLGCWLRWNGKNKRHCARTMRQELRVGSACTGN